jgi:hypothetical protein
MKSICLERISKLFLNTILSTRCTCSSSFVKGVNHAKWQLIWSLNGNKTFDDFSEQWMSVNGKTLSRALLNKGQRNAQGENKYRFVNLCYCLLLLLFVIVIVCYCYCLLISQKLLWWLLLLASKTGKHCYYF